MSETGRVLLSKLLAQIERGGRQSLPITERYAPEYFTEPDLAERDQVHAYLQNAEARGAVTLEWGKHEAAQDLVRIRLKDATGLADYLGVKRAPNLAIEIEAELAPVVAAAPGWMRDALRMALGKWRQGQPALGLRVENKSEIEQLFRAAAVIAVEQPINQDFRSFSVRVLGDSKAVERMSTRLASLLRWDPALSHIGDAGKLFDKVGLQKFSAPVFIKGPIIIWYGSARLDLSPLKPYVALSADTIRSIETTNQPDYVLTIENLSSFHRYTRVIDDRGIVIYSGGFAGSALLALLSELDTALPEEVRFFHWGDRDLGGWRIFECIQKALVRHPLSPHMMTVRTPDAEPFTSEDRKALIKYSEISTGKARELARAWLERDLGYMEQELLDPVSPGTMKELADA